MHSSVKLTFGALLAAGLALTNAHAGTFSTTDNSISGIGAEFATPYDKFAMAGTNGSFNGGAPATVGDLSFAVGGNCYSCTLTPSGTLTFSMTVGNVTETDGIGWSWSSTGPVDTLAMTAPSELTFAQAGGEIDTIDFSVDPTLLAGGNGDIATGTLMATETVPEPLSLSVIGVGLMGLGMVKRRNRITPA
jgi:hypothetical protein